MDPSRPSARGRTSLARFIFVSPPRPGLAASPTPGRWQGRPRPPRLRRTRFPGSPSSPAPANPDLLIYGWGGEGGVGGEGERKENVLKPALLCVFA